MRLVINYNNGVSPYSECYTDVIYCMECESIEALQALISGRVAVYASEHAEYLKAFEKWRKERENILKKHRDNKKGKKADRDKAMTAEIAEHAKTAPDTPKVHFKVGETEMTVTEFMIWDREKKGYVESMPTILTLDEWFEKKSRNEI